jgi:DNA-binding XRE family transcriptional regulator
MELTMTESTITTRNSIMKNPAAECFIENIKIYLRIKSAFDECSDDIKEVVNEMVDISNSSESTEDEKRSAIYTIVEAIFPALAADLLESCEKIRKSPKPQEYNNKLISQEEFFANQVREIMTNKNITQEQLAERIGVGQSAICNMLNRKCRPQRRTIEKVAKALDVEVDALWIDINADSSSE